MSRAVNGQFQPGQSGNPRGRTPGTSTASKLRKIVEKDMPAIVKAMVTQAKGGDIQAATVLMDRVWPKLKPEAAPMEIQITGDTRTDRNTVFQAVATGLLPVDRAAEMLALLEQDEPTPEPLKGGMTIEEINARLEVLMVNTEEARRKRMKELAEWEERGHV